MRTSLRLLPVLSALLLGACTDQKTTYDDDIYGTGPFDSAGNYREDWADDPSKWRRPGKRVVNPPPVSSSSLAMRDEPPPNSVPLAASRPAPSRPASSASTTRSRETTRSTASRPKPKPKTTVAKAKAKPKAKPKPKTVRYVVKRGDTLSGIAGRYGTSVSALRRTNGISGSIIRPGQSLTIPKR
jgi:LysM repeat protein